MKCRKNVAVRHDQYGCDVGKSDAAMGFFLVASLSLSLSLSAGRCLVGSFTERPIKRPAL